MLRAEGDGWFNPFGESASMDNITEAHTLQHLEVVNREDSEAIRPVAYRQRPRLQVRGPAHLAMNGDELSWSLDEDVALSFAEGAPKMTEEVPPEAEVLPSEAIRVRPTEEKPRQTAVPASLPEDGLTEPETGWEGDSRKRFEDLVPGIGVTEPQREDERMSVPAPTAGVPKSNTPQEPGVPSLPQAGTRIDRFGNIGYLENNYASRTQDGGLAGNPYADGVFDFHPRYFPWDPYRQTHTREFPPCESYGTDGYGCPMAYEEDGVVYYNGCHTGGCCGLFGCIWSALYPLLRHSDLSAGAYAYRDPFEISHDSNFGFDLGFNWTLPRRIFGLTWQAGFRYTRSGKEEVDFEELDIDFAEDEYHRTQLFWTSGLFYRHPGSPWKFGAVYDSVRDETMWTYTIGQVRAELSRSIAQNTDIGFRGAFRLDDELLNFSSRDKNYTGKFSAQNYYTGFLRHTFVTGAEGMVSAGVTEAEEALIGARLEVPVTNHSCIRNNFVYIFPKDREKKDTLDDSWSASISWVVYFGGSSYGGLANPFKPLFDVADNTTFLQRAK